jgi:hypothetical protein
LKIYKKSNETIENLQKLGANIQKLATDFTVFLLPQRAQRSTENLVLTKVEKEFKIWVLDREASELQSRIYASLRG